MADMFVHLSWNGCFVAGFELKVDVPDGCRRKEEHGTKHAEEIIGYHCPPLPVEVTVDALHPGDFRRPNPREEFIGNHAGRDIFLWLSIVAGHEVEAAC